MQILNLFFFFGPGLKEDPINYVTGRQKQMENVTKTTNKQKTKCILTGQRKDKGTDV